LTLSKAVRLKTSVKYQKKRLNKNRIIRLLYAHKTLTNAYLVKETGLSLPTVSNLLTELSEEGFIEVQGAGESSGGRRPNLVGLTNTAFYSIAVDMDRYVAKIALVNSNNDVIGEPHSFDLNIYKKEETVNILTDQINDFIKSLEIDTERLIGVSLSLPGLTNSSEGINYTFLNFGSQPLSEILRKRTGQNVYIINDAQARALAELRYGKARNARNALVNYLGFGLGTGLILDGKLYQGSNGFAGEFSHIPVVDNGILCHCGKRGCLETIASGSALERLAIKGIENGEHTELVNIIKNHKKQIFYMDIVDSALKGDSFAIDILSQVGSELGRGIAMLVQILNPELIIFGGQMIKAGHLLTIPVEHSLIKYCINDLRTSVKIEMSEIGGKASLIGAVINLTENIFITQ
jgi:predicted NBD/HSP70 family sugar kinase